MATPQSPYKNEEEERQELLLEKIAGDIAKSMGLTIGEHLYQGKIELGVAQIAKVLAVACYIFTDALIKQCEVNDEDSNNKDEKNEEKIIQYLENNKIDLLNMTSDMIRHTIGYQVVEGGYHPGEHENDKDVLEHKEKIEARKLRNRNLD